MLRTWRTPRMVPEAELADLRWPSRAIGDAAANLNAAVLGGYHAGLLVFVDEICAAISVYVDDDPDGAVTQVAVLCLKRVNPAVSRYQYA